MANYLHATVPYAGILLDGFVTPDGKSWVTLSSIANGLGFNRQTPRNWVTRRNLQYNEVLPVRVGQFNKAAEAYPVEVIGQFVEAFAKKGNQQCQALLTASFTADLERSVKEANGLQVTAAQHEERREGLRLELLKAALEGYEPYRQGNRVTYLYDERDLSHLTPDEWSVACDLAYIRTKQADMFRNPCNAAPIQQRIDHATEELLKDGVPVHELV